MKLNIDQNIEKPDALYETLIEPHRGLADENCRQVYARLVLLFANHVGNTKFRREATHGGDEAWLLGEFPVKCLSLTSPALRVSPPDLHR